MSQFTLAGPRVFVLDDEPALAWSLALILRKHGYNASAFVDPRHVLETMERSIPHLVISDMMMPEMTGIQLALRVGKRSPSSKVLLFSGQAEASELREQAASDGISLDVLAKPLKIFRLLDEVRCLLPLDGQAEVVRSANTSIELRGVTISNQPVVAGRVLGYRELQDELRQHMPA